MTTSNTSPLPDTPSSTDPVERCIDHLKGGLNCAESVLHGFNECYDLGLPESARGIATPFGAGVSTAKCLCGGVSGGLMALGLARGRTSASEPAGPAFDAGRELHSRFLDHFQSVYCRDLTAHLAWDQPERREACQAYVRYAAEVVHSILDGDGRPVPERQRAESADRD
ncbi:MAG: hypothetical protein HKP61_02590 [Dactylosporangium sp.]|nr:C-GCAxxG-C-C family protein [Dactylosporangium sp.]NNJ59850.1 hypothetical protein [Dactylosporangium sp.]